MGDATSPGPVFHSFREFYPHYLAEHASRWNRRLHFAGQTLAVSLLVAAVVSRNWWLLLAVPVGGYGVSWVGHFFVEGNRPATFRYPVYSLLGDLRMCRDMLTGRMPF